MRRVCSDGQMSPSREEKVAEYFNCSIRERAVFEAGIKLAAVYHQFIGTPISASNAESLERAIEEGVKVQPFVEDVKVSVDRSRLREKKNEYDYQSLTAEMLDVLVKIKIKNIRVTSRMRYIKDVRYPLMYVEEISED